jgi:hypothetical protein
LDTRFDRGKRSRRDWFGAGRTNEFEHLFVAVEWLGRPVFGNLREQAVLDGIPLAME